MRNHRSRSGALPLTAQGVDHKVQSGGQLVA